MTKIARRNLIKSMVAVGVGVGVTGSPQTFVEGKQRRAQGGGAPVTYQGTVNGIDVIATPGQEVRCLAFINKRPGGDYVQVTTSEHRLQTALESASARSVEVEVSYVERGNEKRLTRVRLLDRR